MHHSAFFGYSMLLRFSTSNIQGAKTQRLEYGRQDVYCFRDRTLLFLPLRPWRADMVGRGEMTLFEDGKRVDCCLHPAGCDRAGRGDDRRSI